MNGMNGMNMIKRMKKAAMLATLGLGPAVAMAQAVTVTYGPDLTAVPTLTEWGMIGTAVLLAVAAVVAIRKKTGSKTVISLVLAAAALVGAAQGHVTLLDAAAGAAPAMTSPPGGTVLGINEGDGLIPIENQTAVPQKILSVSPDVVRDRGTTTCKPGVIVAPGQFCNVDAGVNG